MSPFRSLAQFSALFQEASWPPRKGQGVRAVCVAQRAAVRFEQAPPLAPPLDCLLNLDRSVVARDFACSGVKYHILVWERKGNWNRVI